LSAPQDDGLGDRSELFFDSVEETDRAALHRPAVIATVAAEQPGAVAELDVPAGAFSA
jgi:hypothetical protein